MKEITKITIGKIPLGKSRLNWDEWVRRDVNSIDP